MIKIPLIPILLLTITSSFILKSTPDFNETLSKILIKYAGVAFCSAECLESWTCQTTKSVPPLLNVSYITSNLTKAVAYVGYDPANKQIITSWRGSSNAKNWIEDFNFETQPYKCKNCLIHAGFHFDYLSLKKKLDEKTNQLISIFEVRKIICTGHSLGAALSIINGIEFTLSYGKNIEINVHNYGSPRIGNVELAHYLDKNLHLIQRVVHHKDVVPHLPPQSVGYWHAANQIFYNSDMTEYKICNDSGEDKTCSNQYFPDYDPDDHDFYFIHLSEVKC